MDFVHYYYQIMPTTILINLLSCTYGATPWNRAHIEAEIELIPSPVRVLRAVISGAYKIDQGMGDSELLRMLVTNLSHVQPRYHIPKGVYIAHNAYRLDKRGEVGNLHKSGKLYSEPYFEYASDKAYVVVQWDVELDDQMRGLLSDCLSNISYLGRSEHVAQWHLFSQDEELEGIVFNAVPRVGGGCSVLMVTPDMVDELWQVPGVRNSRMVACPFAEVGYEVMFTDKAKLRSGVPLINQLVFFADISYEFDCRWTIDWCDVLHKALCKALPESETFRSGCCITLSGRMFVVDANAFTEAEIFAAQEVRRLWRYDLNGVAIWLERATLVEFVRLCELRSVTPFFMGLAPATKARRSGTYATKRIAGGAFEKMGVEHQAIRELLLREGWEKSQIGELEWVDGGAGELRALLGEELIMSCVAQEWAVGEVWRSGRRSGSRREWMRPAREKGVGLVIRYPVGVAGGVSLGFGASFGLGVLR